MRDEYPLLCVVEGSGPCPTTRPRGGWLKVRTKQQNTSGPNHHHHLPSPSPSHSSLCRLCRLPSRNTTRIVLFLMALLYSAAPIHYYPRRQQHLPRPGAVPVVIHGTTYYGQQPAFPTLFPRSRSQCRQPTPRSWPLLIQST